MGRCGGGSGTGRSSPVCERFGDFKQTKLDVKEVITQGQEGQHLCIALHCLFETTK